MAYYFFKSFLKQFEINLKYDYTTGYFATGIMDSYWNSADFD